MAILRKNQMDYMRTKLDRQEKVEEMEALLSRTQGVNGEQVYNPLFSSSAPRYGNGLTALMLNAVRDPLSIKHYDNRDNVLGKSPSTGLLGSLFESLNAKTYESQNNPTLNDFSRGLLLNLAQQNKENYNDWAYEKTLPTEVRERTKALHNNLLGLASIDTAPIGNASQHMAKPKHWLYNTLPQNNNIVNVYDVAASGRYLDRLFSYGNEISNKDKHDFSKDMIPEMPNTKVQKTIRIFPNFEGEPPPGNAKNLLDEWRATLREHKFMYETTPSIITMISDFVSGGKALPAVSGGKIVVNEATNLLKLHKLIEPLSLLYSKNYDMCSRDTECNPILQDLHEVLGTLVKIK